MKDSEDVITTANREPSEESGLIAASSQEIGYFYVNNRRSDERQHVVLSIADTLDDISAGETISWIEMAKLHD